MSENLPKSGGLPGTEGGGSSHQAGVSDSPKKRIKSENEYRGKYLDASKACKNL
jgi:hypothetical protein